MRCELDHADLDHGRDWPRGRATAAAIARQLDIDEVAAEVLPAGKIAALKRLRINGAWVALGGGGINDAPARSVTKALWFVAPRARIETPHPHVKSGSTALWTRALSLRR